MVVGVFAYSAIKAALEKPVLVAVALIVGGFAILVFERLVKHPRLHSVEDLPWPTAVKIGIVQCLSMLPGRSRSGATVLGSLVMGVERRTAAEFGFSLAVPPQVAATVHALLKSAELLVLLHKLGIAG